MEIAGNYENEVIDAQHCPSVDAGLRLEVQIKPEIRGGSRHRTPADHAPHRLRPAARRRADEYIITSGALKGQRGFFTRDETGAVAGADLAGRLFRRAPAAR